MTPTLIYVTNQTRSFVHLPPVPRDGRWPTGIRLIPGLNRVPSLYLEALKAASTPVFDEGGRPITVDEDVVREDAKGKPVTYREKKPVVRYPGREALAELAERKIRLTGPRGVFTGTQIVIHAPGEIDENAADGPLPPDTLPENPVHAAKVVESCSDREALERWLESESRDEVASAIRARLAGGV